MLQLQKLVLDALESIGYGVIESIELWNAEYLPSIRSAPAGKNKIIIGKFEISYTKV